MPKEIRIRNIPDKVHNRIALAATARGLSVEDYVIDALQELIGDARRIPRPRNQSPAAERRAFYEQAARECLASLTPPEAQVMQLRLGIGDAQPHSLQSIADQLGVSRQRVHQIESSARRKLSHPARLDVLAFAMRKLQILDRQVRWVTK